MLRGGGIELKGGIVCGMSGEGLTTARPQKPRLGLAIFRFFLTLKIPILRLASRNRLPSPLDPLRYRI